MVRCQCLLRESTCNSVQHVACIQQLDTDMLSANWDRGWQLHTNVNAAQMLICRSALAGTSIMLRPLILVLKMMDDKHGK